MQFISDEYNEVRKSKVGKKIRETIWGVRKMNGVQTHLKINQKASDNSKRE